MTGEYCSKQMNIQRERREQHENDRINAFVIMNFSDMSDVVYKWRIHDYIEDLKVYFASVIIILKNIGVVVAIKYMKG